MPARNIVMLNINDTARDPRVRRFGRTLASLDHRVTVLERREKDQPGSEALDGFEIQRVEGPRSFQNRDMAALRMLSARAGGIVGSAAADVMDLPIERRLVLQRKVYRRGTKLIQRVEKRTGRSLDLFHRAISVLQAPAVQNQIMVIRSMMLINLALARRGIELRPDIVHANDLNSLLAGLIIKEKTGAKLVYDAHEIYPEQFPVHRRSELWHSFYTRLEEQLIPFTDGRITVCDSLADYFVRRYKSEPFVTVRNVPSIRLLPPESVLKKHSDVPRLVYHGAFFQDRGLEELVRAAKYLRGGTIILRGFGDQETPLRKLAAEIEVEERVKFAPAVKVDELVATASECEVGLNPFPSACLNTEYALPNKFFEYMMAGLAVASSRLIELERLTTSLGVGILFRSLEPQAIAEDLEALIADRSRLDEYRRASYEHARKTYHWEIEQQRLIDLYARLW